MHIFLQKRAIITGAAAGIGRALAVLLAQRGANLLLIDRDEAGLVEAAAECRTLGVEAITRVVDLADSAAVDGLAGEVNRNLGPIDLLINNAGVVHFGPTADMSSDDLERLIAVNLLAPLRLTRAFLPQLLSRPDAHVVNVSSMYGFLATPNCSAYHTSKFGLFGFSESLHVELRRTNVGVTTVCPGFVATRLFEHGTGGEPSAGVPHPPAWLTTTPEHVARRVLRGIERHKRLVIVTPLAWTFYYVNRYAPWMLPWLSKLGPQP